MIDGINNRTNTDQVNDQVLLDQLKSYKTQNSKQTTSAISLIVPQMNITDLRSFIRQEQVSAQNIRNRTNRKSVLSALSDVDTIVRNMKEIPSTGIAIFTGCYI